MGTTVVNSVTYVGSTGSISFADIKAAYSNVSSSMSGYKGRKYYKSDFSRGNLSSGSIKFSDFRGTGGNIARVDRNSWPSIGKHFQSGNITLPPGFNTVSFIVYGNGGGGGGGNGSQCIQLNPNFPYNCLNAIVVNGGAGGTGGTTSITINGTVYSATGGAGGNQGVGGANGTPDPGSRTDGYPGGTGNGGGGKGGIRDVAVINADSNWAAASALFGSTLAASYGAAGAGGAGGNGNLTSGASGSAAPYATAGISVFIDSGLY